MIAAQCGVVANKAIGGARSLAGVLRTGTAELKAWLDGSQRIPRAAFLRAVEFILDEIDSLERVQQRSASAAFKSRRVVVVDDNPDSARMMCALLRELGHEAETAVFLDIGLPGIDGFQVAAMLRHEPGCERLKIVAVTGLAGEAERAKSLQVGIDYYLVEPLDISFIESLIGRR